MSKENTAMPEGSKGSIDNPIEMNVGNAKDLIDFVRYTISKNAEQEMYFLFHGDKFKLDMEDKLTFIPNSEGQLSQEENPLINALNELKSENIDYGSKKTEIKAVPSKTKFIDRLKTVFRI